MSNAPTLEQAMRAELGEIVFANVKLRNALMTTQVEMAKMQVHLKEKDGIIADLKAQLAKALEDVNGPELPGISNGAAHGKLN